MSCFPAHRMSIGSPFPSCQNLWFPSPLLDTVTGTWVQHHSVSVTSPAAPVLIVSHVFLANPLHGREFPGSVAELPFAGVAEAAQCGPVSHQVCHGCVVPWSCREDGGAVPAPAGELRHLGGAGRAPRGQPVRRPEEPCGLCPDDHALVMVSQMLLSFLWLHPWGLLHREGGRHPGTFCYPAEALSLEVFMEREVSPPCGETVWKEAGGFLLLLWAHRDKRCPWDCAVPALEPGTCQWPWL